MLHNARKECLMKNKTKLTFLAVAMSTFMILSACNNGPSTESSSDATSSISSTSSFDSSSSSSEAPKPKYRVQFVSEGTVVYTQQVEEGGTAEYKGDLPLKESNSVTNKYRFSGWDKNIEEPITQDTVFTAQFTTKTYTPEVKIDDFESYTETGDMIDEGWEALVYNDSTKKWTTETKAAVSLSTNSAEGDKALRLDVWSNGVGYKAAKVFERTGVFNQSVNALQFRLMAPTYASIKIILETKVRINGETQTPKFTYTIGKPENGQYIDYTIPLSDDGWVLWGEQGKTIKAVAGWSGVHQDDILKFLTRLEFYLEANDRDKKGFPYVAFVDSVRFISSETVEAVNSMVESPMELYSTYTGTLVPENPEVSQEQNILRFDINNNSATAKIIDLEEPQTINGAVTRNDKEFTFTSADNGQTLTYKGRITSGGQLINFVSATGTLAKRAKDMSLNALVGIEDFEQYPEGGVAFCANSPNAGDRTGVYQNYYGEYYSGTGSSEWGGNGWNILPEDGQQLQLVKDAEGAHSGEKYLKLQNNKDNAFRYMQWGLYDGSSEKNYYRGATLSFWAKTEGFVPTFMVACYSQTSPKNATKDDSVKKNTFAMTGEVKEWKHFEVTLDPQLVYYGYLVFMEKTQAAEDSYLLIDDVEIYGANPYAKYEIPEPEKGPEPVVGLNYTATINGLVNVDLTIKENNAATLSSSGLNLTLNGTYAVNEENDDVTFTFEGGIEYVATISKDIKDLTFKSVSGDGVAQYLNNLSFKMIDYADNAETYLTDGIMYYQSNKSEANLFGARGAYYCDFKHGNETYTSPVGGSTWILMGGQGDQLQLDKVNSYEGKQSLKMKKSTAGDMRYMEWGLYKGTAEAKTGFDRFSVAIKNVDTETKMKIMVYKIQKVTPSTQFDPDCVVTKELTLEAGQDWTVYNVQLDPSKNYYGYCIYLDKDSVVDYINVDDARYYNTANNPAMYFSSPKDLVLNNGDDGIKFNGNDNALITCAAMNLNEYACKYEMAIVNNKQIMTITVADKEIKGEYTVDMTGKVVFKVTEIDSALAAIYPVGTEFKNK